MADRGQLSALAELGWMLALGFGCGLVAGLVMLLTR